MERLFAAIPSVLSGLGSSAETDEALVIAAWRECAGELLSERTAATEFFENRLVIAVADETWRRHLEELAPQLLYKLNSRLADGTVSYIEFVVDAASISNKDRPKSGEIDLGHAAEIEPSLADAAAAIADENLREQFINTAAVYLAKQKQLNNGR